MTRLEEVRRSRGWTQPELAAIAKLPTSTIWRIEEGIVKPKVTTQEKLARALRVDRLYLFPPATIPAPHAEAV